MRVIGVTCVLLELHASRMYWCSRRPAYGKHKQARCLQFQYRRDACSSGSSTPSLYLFVTSSLCYFITLLLHHFITSSLCYFISLLLHNFVTSSLYLFVTSSLHHFVTSSLCYFISLLLHHSITLLLHHLI